VKVTWIGNALSQRGLRTLHDPGISDSQAAQTTILNTSSFQFEDLDAYDSDCDDVSNAKAVSMVNLSNYGLNVILETRALSKEHCDSMIDQLNSKSMENADLKGQIQEKVFVTTTLQKELRKLKGKNALDNAATITNATSIEPRMFKLDLDPLAHRLLKNRDDHIDYLKYT
nr:hypothetical protein [Tanacetum cinerariifolium]